jgi:hypothetical protein
VQLGNFFKKAKKIKRKNTRQNIRKGWAYWQKQPVIYTLPKKRALPPSLRSAVGENFNAENGLKIA